MTRTAQQPSEKAGERQGKRRQKVAAYKSILRAVLDQRPSGLRQRIARVLGTHKSFVSQITNPADPTPIPARHLGAIFEICHLAQGEKTRFLEAYREAHPKQGARFAALGQLHLKTLHLEVPLVDDPVAQEAMETLIRDFARGVGELMARSQHRETD